MRNKTICYSYESTQVDLTLEVKGALKTVALVWTHMLMKSCTYSWMSWRRRRKKGCSLTVCYTPTLATWSNITKIIRSATLLVVRDQKLSKVKHGIVDGEGIIPLRQQWCHCWWRGIIPSLLTMPGRILEEVWFLVGYNFEQPMLNSQAIITYQCWYWVNPVVF